MAKQTQNAMLLQGSFRKAGVTFYVRQGKMVARTAHSDEKKSNTPGQFVQRMRMRHTIALWQMLEPCKPIFTERKTAYLGFASLANRLPAVYVPRSRNSMSLLMPGIPVSDGTLAPINERLGEVDGTAALITDLKAGELQRGEKLMLYTAVQDLETHTPRVRFEVREASLSEMVEVDGYLALKGEEFADTMKGWALVRVDGDRCSTQALLTECTFYQQYTTDEALREAAESYGGFTD